jgi:hypothetical protein
MSKTIKLKAIHTYQYVVFQNKNHQFFTESKELGLQGLELEYYPEMNAVKVKTEKDEIIVFCTNIAYARPIEAVGSELNRGKIKDRNPGDSVR